MEVILLEKIANLGNLGDKVNVKAGYGHRNYLLPQGKATAATAENVAVRSRVAPSWKLPPRRKLRPNRALPNWLSWKSPSPLWPVTKASCSVPSVLTTSPTLRPLPVLPAAERSASAERHHSPG